jgi:putative oxidoreductase
VAEREGPVMRWVERLARWAVALVFVAAALPKIADPTAFAADLGDYRLFPAWSIVGLAALVPMLELVGAAALVSGWQRRGGAWLLGLLTVGFLLVIGSVIYRGVDLRCGCFGRDAAAEAVGWPLLWRDVGLLTLIVIAGGGARRRPW